MSKPYWTLTLERARKRVAVGEYAFTRQERHLASQWVTCACGQLDSRIPLRDPDEPECGPKDNELARLGVQFSLEVGRHDIDAAELTLAKIDMRASEILRGVAR